MNSANLNLVGKLWWWGKFNIFETSPFWKYSIRQVFETPLLLEAWKQDYFQMCICASLWHIMLCLLSHCPWWRASRGSERMRERKTLSWETGRSRQEVNRVKWGVIPGWGEQVTLLSSSGVTPRLPVRRVTLQALVVRVTPTLTYTSGRDGWCVTLLHFFYHLLLPCLLLACHAGWQPPVATSGSSLAIVTYPVYLKFFIVFSRNPRSWNLYL